MLKRELAFYEANRDEYIQYYEGQWVLIHEATFLGSYSTQEQAYAAALEKVGNVPVLIHRVSKDEEPALAVPALLVGLTGGRS